MTVASGIVERSVAANLNELSEGVVHDVQRAIVEPLAQERVDASERAPRSAVERAREHRRSKEAHSVIGLEKNSIVLLRRQIGRANPLTTVERRRTKESTQLVFGARGAIHRLGERNGAEP